jgi:hypothetical protein
MATYYKYAEREADSQINWAEIGKNLSDTLQEANKIREDKKTAIDEATRDFSKTLADAPQGEDGLANQRTLDFANDMTELMLIQERLLKSGQLKFKDYAIVRQNSVDSTAQLFGLSQEYQEEYKKKMERMKQGVSSKKEQLEMEQVEGYSNLSTMKPYVDPTTGNVSMAKIIKKEIDGKIVDVMDDNPNNRIGVNDARNRLKSYWDKFNVTSALSEVETVLGSNIESLRNVGGRFKAGEIITTEDITNKKDFEDATNLYVQAEDNFIKGLLSNGFNVESVLLDHKVFAENGKEYSYTLDKNEQSPDKILMKVVNGVSVMDEEGTYYKDQYSASTDYMKKQLRVMLDKKQTINTYSEPANFAPNYGSGGGGDQQQDRTEEANMLGLLYYGNQQEVQAATDYFSGVDPSIEKITRFNDVIKVQRVIRNEDGEYVRTEIDDIKLRDANGQAIAQDRFIQSGAANLLGISNIFDAVKQGSYNKNRTISNVSTKKGIGTSRLSSDRKKSINKSINTSQY